LILTVPAKSMKMISLTTTIWMEMIKNINWWKKIVHFIGGHILATEHLLACKVVLVFHAGSKTSKLASMNKTAKEMACLLAYKQAIVRSIRLYAFFGWIPEFILLAPSRKRMNQWPLKHFTHTIWIQGAWWARCALIPLFLPVNFLYLWRVARTASMTHVMTCWLRSSERNWPWTVSWVSPLRNRKLAFSPILGIQDKTMVFYIDSLNFLQGSNFAEVLGNANNIPLSWAAQKRKDQKHLLCGLQI
jgi:hypothetical protein